MTKSIVHAIYSIPTFKVKKTSKSEKDSNDVTLCASFSQRRSKSPQRKAEITVKVVIFLA
jgi:hypothetical protein